MSLSTTMDIAKYLEDTEFNLESPHIRNTEEGLFINETSLEYIASRLLKHIRNSSFNGILSKKDIRTEIEDNNKYYLSEDDNCLVGYVINKANVKKAILNHGILISCREKIMKNDPIFRYDKNIEILNNQRYCALFNLDKIYHIGAHSFEMFVHRMDKSEAMKKQLRNKFPHDLRDYMKSLYIMIKSSVLVDRKNYISQILKNNFKECEYRTNHGWIFVIEKGNMLKTCYEVGKISKKGYKLK